MDSRRIKSQDVDSNNERKVVDLGRSADAICKFPAYVTNTTWSQTLDTNLLQAKHYPTSAYFAMCAPDLHAAEHQFPAMFREQLHVSLYYVQFPIASATKNYMWRVGQAAIHKFYEDRNLDHIDFAFKSENDSVLDSGPSCTGYICCLAVGKASVAALLSCDEFGPMMVPTPHMSWH